MFFTFFFNLYQNFTLKTFDNKSNLLDYVKKKTKYGYFF